MSREKQERGSLGLDFEFVYRAVSKPALSVAHGEDQAPDSNGPARQFADRLGLPMAREISCIPSPKKRRRFRMIRDGDISHVGGVAWREWKLRRRVLESSGASASVPTCSWTLTDIFLSTSRREGLRNISITQAVCQKSKFGVIFRRHKNMEPADAELATRLKKQGSRHAPSHLPAIFCIAPASAINQGSAQQNTSPATFQHSSTRNFAQIQVEGT